MVNHARGRGGRPANGQVGCAAATVAGRARGCALLTAQSVDTPFSRTPGRGCIRPESAAGPGRGSPPLTPPVLRSRRRRWRSWLARSGSAKRGKGCAVCYNSGEWEALLSILVRPIHHTSMPSLGLA